MNTSLVVVFMFVFIGTMSLNVDSFLFWNGCSFADEPKCINLCIFTQNCTFGTCKSSKFCQCTGCPSVENKLILLNGNYKKIK